MRSGKSIEIGNLRVALGECRYPVANPVGDAFAHLNIQNVDTNDTVFKGWIPIQREASAKSVWENGKWAVWGMFKGCARTQRHTSLKITWHAH